VGIRKDVIIAIITTFCLASAIFMISARNNPGIGEAHTRAKVYKAVEEITILDVSRTINGVERGMFTYSDDCTFGFSPREGFIEVTMVSGNLYGYCETPGIHPYRVEINRQYWPQGPAIDQIGSNVMHSRFDCSDPSVLSTMKPGINMLTIDFLGDHVFIMKVTLLIEYEYQA